MLKILNDPAGITGGQLYQLDYNLTIQANIEKHLASGADCELYINDVLVDPLTDIRMGQKPSILDSVTVKRRPQGDPITWLYVIGGVLAGLAVTYALMPKINTDAGATAGKDSPNNRLTGQSNIARAYQAIPDVYGYRRVWPDLIQPSTIEYIDNIKYVTEWLCVSRGKGTVTDIQYAETPIADISGASYEMFEPSGANPYPEFNSTTITDVYETFAIEEVNGQELEYPVQYATLTPTGSFIIVNTESVFKMKVTDGPSLAQLKSMVPSGTAQVSFTYIDTGSPVVFDEACTVQSFLVVGADCTFTFTNTTPWTFSSTQTGIAFTVVPDEYTRTTIGPFTLPIECDRLRWNTIFPRGLVGSVDIKAEWWRVDSGGVEVGGTRQSSTDTYTSGSFDQLFYTKTVTPSGGTGRYRIEFTRMSAQVGTAGNDVAKLEEVYAVRYYATKVLPGVTVFRITTKATTDATGFSDKKFNLRWTRHVRTLTSNTLSASRNFARAMAHVWTLAGNDIAELDTTALQAINTELGETSDLLRFDCSIDDADISLGERMQNIANHARCIIWRDGQKWTVTRDQARQYPEVQFDYRNLDVGGDSAISYSAHLPATFDGVEIEYVDPVSQAKKVYFRLNITSGIPVVGVSGNPSKIKLIGCTSESQAMNRAYLEANRLIYQRISVSDTALCDYQTIGLGSLVRWVDPADFAGDDGLQAGEVLSIVGTVITTSEILDFKGQPTGRILFTGTEGQRLAAPVVCSQLPGNAIQLASVPAGLYVAGAGRQLGSRYAFGVGLTDSELESSGLYSVTAIKPLGDGKASLELAFYDDRIYSED